MPAHCERRDMSSSIPHNLSDAGPPADYALRLYIAGQSPKSVTALNNLCRVCDQHLSGRYSIDVIDLM